MYEARILTVDVRHDVATLHSIATALYPSLEVGTVELGDSVWSWSFPLSFDVLMLQGTYAGILLDRAKPTERTHYITLNSIFGASGSIVLNARGEAVGVISAVFGSRGGMPRLTGTIMVELPELGEPE